MAWTEEQLKAAAKKAAAAGDFQTVEELSQEAERIRQAGSQGATAPAGQGGKWQITAPDGQRYMVTGDNADGALAALKQMLEGQSDGRTSHLPGPRPIEVEAPDGTIVEFPAETDDLIIDRVMRENFSPQPSPAGQGRPAAEGLTKEQVLGAIRKADAAGEYEDAQRLAEIYRQIDAPDATNGHTLAQQQALALARARRSRAESADQGAPRRSGPWEKYQKSGEAGADGPWSKYAAQSQPPTAYEVDASGEESAIRAYREFTGAGQNAPAPKAGGILANAGVGTQRGIADLVGMPVDALTSAMNGLGNLTGLWGEIKNPVGGSESIYNALSPFHDHVAEPQTAGEQLARRVGHGVSSAALSGAGASAAAGRGLLSTLTGDAIAGAGAGMGGGLMQMVTDNPLADLAGSVVGSIAAPAAVNGISRGVTRMISPNGGADPARLAAARTLDQHGVQTTAGQKVGNDTLRRMEAGTEAGRARLAAQDEQFTQAALRSIGSDAKRATPEVLEEAQRRIGRVFDDVLGDVTLKPSQTTAQRATAAVEAYRELAPAAEAAPLIANVGKRLADAAASGQSIGGLTAKAWRSQLSKALKSPSEATRTAAADLLEALDDATSQALSAAGRGRDMDRLTTARRQWRDFLAIERAMAGAGEAASVGVLSPARLRSAISGQGARAYTQGRRGELGDLARAGTAVLGRPSSSGTVENAGSVLKAGLGIMGTAAAQAAGGGPLISPLIGVGAAMAPTAINRLAITQPMQRYFSNQLAGAAPVAARNALSGAMPGLLPFMNGGR